MGTLHCWGGGESELGTTLQEGNLAVYTEVLEMCILRAGDSVSENFSKGNRYVAGASRIFFTAELLITVKNWKPCPKIGS